MPSNHRKGSFQRKKHQGYAIQTVEVAPTTCQLTPTVANTHQPRIPEPQAVRVKLKYISGQTVRSISRSESLARRTVARVVQCKDVQDYVARLRAQFYSLGDDAIDAVRQGLKAGDSRMAYEILKDIGAVPSVEDRRLATMLPAAEQDKDAGVKKVMARLANIAFERARVFGTPLGQLEHDLEEAGGKFDQDTGRVTVVDEG
jgi:hypothetical protein